MSLVTTSATGRTRTDFRFRRRHFAIPGEKAYPRTTDSEQRFQALRCEGSRHRSEAIYGLQWHVIKLLHKVSHSDEAFRRHDALLQAYEAF
jgi:hypothetical protein